MGKRDYITLPIAVITPVATGRGPPCIKYKIIPKTLQLVWLTGLPQPAGSLTWGN